MSVSLRDDILTSVKTALSGITTTGGYNTTVNLVDTRIKDPEGLNPDQFPALFITDGTEVKTDHDVDGLICTLQIIVSGILKEANHDEDLGLVVRKLVADVEKAVCADRYRGQLAINTKPREIKTDAEAFRPYGLFDVTFEITYLQKYGDVTVNG